jgi:flagellar hook-length control protein FliK
MKAIAIETINQNVKNNTKNTKDSNVKDIKNVDFLELLLKNIKTNNTKQVNNVDVKTDTQKEGKDELTKELQELLKELILNNKDSNNILNNLPQNIINKLNFNKDIVKEIKNIITSNLKQQNILLNKSDIKNFKKIDNIKDLFTFANKKGLNIEKLTFKIAKEIQNRPKIVEDIKQLIIPNQKSDINPKQIATTEILSTKKEIKKSIEINTDNKQTNQKISLTQIIKNKTTNDKKNISLTNILSNKKDTKTANNNQIDKQTNKQVNLKNILNTKTTQEIHLHQMKNNSIEINEPKHSIKDIKAVNTNKITLDSLLHKDDKTNSHNSQKEPLNINSQITQNVNINELKAKQVLAKETINHFKNNLDEAIKNYKPPVSKVNIELNPKNLGKVEVSIIQRRNNITLHIHTDQSNVVLFQTHQAEFRQALSNIGFSNIDMNFNSNQDKERKQNQAKKAYKNSEEDIEIGEIDIQAKYQYA